MLNPGDKVKVKEGLKLNSKTINGYYLTNYRKNNMFNVGDMVKVKDIVSNRAHKQVCSHIGKTYKVLKIINTLFYGIVLEGFLSDYPDGAWAIDRFELSKSKPMLLSEFLSD